MLLPVSAKYLIFASASRGRQREAALCSDGAGAPRIAWVWYSDVMWRVSQERDASRAQADLLEMKIAAIRTEQRDKAPDGGGADDGGCLQ